MKNFKTTPISEIGELPDNPRIMTFGTFDLLHEGHLNIFRNILELTSENNMFIGVSSDAWNRRKNKDALEDESIRLNNIKSSFKEAEVFFEDHEEPEQSWPELYDKYNIDFILMGGDHSENLDYINNIVTPQGRNMKILFFERTEGISSTMLREAIKSKENKK